MEHVLLLDTGDALIGGGILGDRTRGDAIVAGMGLMGYDAMALGPKELLLGPDLLRNRIEFAAFPMLSANVVLDSTETLFAEPYTIVERGRHRIGIIGLTHMPDERRPGFEVLDPVEAAERYVPEISGKADVIVLLTNLGFRPAMRLAQSVPGIDLLVAARPEQLPSAVATVPEVGTLAVTAEQPMARHSGRRVGRLNLTVAGGGLLSAQSWESIAMGREIADDEEMAALLLQYYP